MSYTNVQLLDGSVAEFIQSPRRVNMLSTPRTKELCSALQGFRESVAGGVFQHEVVSKEEQNMLCPEWMLQSFVKYLEAIRALEYKSYVKVVSVDMRRLQAAEPDLLEHLTSVAHYHLQEGFMVIVPGDLRHHGKVFYGKRTVDEAKALSELTGKTYPPIASQKPVRIFPTEAEPKTQVGLFVYSDISPTKGHAVCRVALKGEGGRVTYRDYYRNQIQPIQTSSKTYTDIGQSIWHSVEKLVVV